MAAEGLLVNGITEIVKKLSSIAGHEIGLIWGYRSELTELRSNLDTIQAYLVDAENRQVTDTVVRSWLKRLKKVAYDAEDILDEVSYDTLRRKIEIQNQIKKKVIDCFSLSNSIAFRLKVAHKIQDVNNMLNRIRKDMKAFTLHKVEGNRNASSESSSTAANRETFSLIDDSQVSGRRNDAEKMKEMLLTTGSNVNEADDETVSVIPIVGFGGIGKTTLAQLLYNDEEVKKYFEFRNWVSVSNHSGDTTLLKIVSKAICKSDANLSTKEQMRRSLETKLLEEKANEKKCLIVLDDVWNEKSAVGVDMPFQEQWDDLKLALKCCVSGGKIIVTTRNERVADIMGTTVSPYHLGLLSEDDCWAVFEKWAFRRGGPKKSPALEAIGREIVKKCGGVPLAAKTLGGLMHSKKTPEEWSSINNSEILNNTTASGGDSDIMRVLKLSYDHLSPPLKRCFSCCAIFPKGHDIKKNDLIQLWMAQGFLQSSSNNYDIENVGNDNFNTLCGSCFFQDIRLNKYGETKWCKMHDFMHDLALSTSGKECLFVDSTTINANDISETYHLWVENDDFDLEHLCANAENLSAVRKLRTFVLDSFKVNADLLTNFKCLRVLALRFYSETLLASIGQLKHLRYLCIFNGVVEVLPESICQLYKLQILDVEDCENLKELPRDLWKLTNLRHLAVGKHTKMPKGFGRLEDLRELPTLVAGLWEAGCEIEELENLNRLRGRLRIYGMQNVTDAGYTEKARLKEKSNVYILELFWDNKDDRNEGNYDEVLEAMQAPPSLTKIRIEAFPGGNLPKWLTNASVLPLLVEMNLIECNGCREIPAFWRHLPCLEVLLIDKMSCVKRLGGYDENAADQEEQRTMYDPPSLKRLYLTNMDLLEDWPEDSFPHLEELIVEDCPKLRIISTHFPVLKKMDIKRIKSLVVLEEEEESTAAAAATYNNLTSLTSLSIVGVSKFTTLPKVFLQNREHLQKVKIFKCPRFQGFLAAPPALRPSSLKDIEVSHCYSVTTMDLSGCASLRTLTLGGLPSLGGLQSLQPHHCSASMPMPDFTLLKHLRLSECPALTSLDVSRCTCLEELKVFRCKNLMISISTPLPSLKQLIIHRICRLVVEEAAVSSNSLIELSIEGVPEFTTLPNGFLRDHKHLKRILLVDCPKFQGFLHEDEAAKLLLTSPSRIRIKNCPCVMSLDIRGWDSLTELTLMNCPGVMKPSLQGLALVSLPSLQAFHIGDGFSFSEEELDYFPFPTCPMPYLWFLTIHGWSKLKSLPHQLQHLSTTLWHLTITHCDGLSALPDWLGNLSSLEFLKIHHCNNLTHFLSTTTHHPFPSLRNLSLAHVCGTFVESAVNNLTFISSLSVEGVPELTALPIGFLLNNKKLEKIKLKSCPMFQGFLYHDADRLQLMASLRELRIKDCQSVTSLDFVRCLASLKKLTLMNCKGIMMSSLEGLESPESLSSLEVGGFSEELDYFPFPARPMQSLWYLKIMGWSKVKSLPEQLQYLTNLHTLIITNFDGLIALPDWIGNFSSLICLEIYHCKNLMHLPSKQDMQRLTLLRELVIEDCPHLAKRCMAGGEEWCKIPDDRVIDLRIDDTYRSKGILLKTWRKI